MSWWVSLVGEDGGVVEVPKHEWGGVYTVGRSTGGSINITYNYSSHFRRVLGGEGLWDLDGVTGEDAIPLLQAATVVLGMETDKDHWKPTPGNAGFALLILLAWATLYPEAVFRVS